MRCIIDPPPARHQRPAARLSALDSLTEQNVIHAEGERQRETRDGKPENKDNAARHLLDSCDL